MRTDACYYSYNVKQKRSEQGDLNKRNVIASVKRKPSDVKSRLGLGKKRSCVRKGRDHVSRCNQSNLTSLPMRLPAGSILVSR